MLPMGRKNHGTVHVLGVFAEGVRTSEPSGRSGGLRLESFLPSRQQGCDL